MHQKNLLPVYYTNFIEDINSIITIHNISGGSSLYITGVTNLASSVEVINPPIITKARGE